MSDQDPPPGFLDWLGLRQPLNFGVARPLGVVFGILVLALFLLALTAATVLLIQTIGQGFTNDAASNLGAGALIVALLTAPFLIWNTVIRQRGLEFQKEGHVTDRISQAVEQLGAEKSVKRNGLEWTEPNIEVRIGGILSLERIAQDSTRYDKGRDHVRVMEILCAYIRQNAPASGAVDFPLAEWEPLADDADEAARKQHEMWRKARFGDNYDANARDWAKSLPGPRADVQLTLRVIGRRSAQQRLVEAQWGNPDPGATWVFDDPCPELRRPKDDASVGEKAIDDFKSEVKNWHSKLTAYAGYRLDLRHTNLQGADLSDLRLGGALLQGCRAEGADLRSVRLEGAYLSAARLEGASLSWAKLECAELSSARLECAGLSAARLEGASLSWARLEGASLSSARLEGADLSLARLEGADLSLARLEGAFLRLARFSQTTSLHLAFLQAARWREVDLTTLPLSQGQIQSTFGDASVQLPKGLTRPAHWPNWKMDGVEFDKNYDAWRADPDGYIPPPPPDPR